MNEFVVANMLDVTKYFYSIRYKSSRGIPKSSQSSRFGSRYGGAVIKKLTLEPVLISEWPTCANTAASLKRLSFMNGTHDASPSLGHVTDHVILPLALGASSKKHIGGEPHRSTTLRHSSLRVVQQQRA